MTMPRRPQRLFFGLGLALLSCREPTEIQLHLHTNVPCSDPTKWKGVAVYVGPPGSSLEGRAPTLTSTTCDTNGEIGTLVVVPSAGKDDEVGLRVVAGIGIEPEQCNAQHYKGCIVARRTVRFNAHTTLQLDIDLSSDCVGLGCDASHTCVNGACADAESATITIDPTEPSVSCGSNGIVCPITGNVCCLTTDFAAGTATGECKPAMQCPPTSTVLNCDDASDCAPDADGGVRACYLGFTYDPIGQGGGHVPNRVAASQCLPPATGGALELCQTRLPCANGHLSCHESVGYPQNPLPGYFWCDH
jgi:hypothetical protein